MERHVTYLSSRNSKHIGPEKGGTWTLKQLERRKMPLSELEEWREKAYHNTKHYKERTKWWHDKGLKKKEFKPADKVLLFNSRVELFRHGKLQSKWKGPYKVISASSHGAVTLQNDEGTLFKVNGQHLKVFHDTQLQEEELDIINFIELK